MKRTIIIILIFSLLISCLPVKQATAKSAGAITIDGFSFTWYELEDKKSCWITKIEVVDESKASVLTVPSSIEGKTVRKIGYRIPKELIEAECMKSVFGIFPEDDADFWLPKDTVKKVGKIEKIVLPETVTEISESCFESVSNLSSLNLPKGLKKLGVNAIACNPKLKTIHIPEGISKNLECTARGQWTNYTISPKNKWYKVKNGFLVTKNGKKLYGPVVNMSHVKIPEGVTTIQEDAFYGNEYKSIHIPSTVTSIGKYAFCSKKPTIFTVSKKNPHYKKDGNCIYSKKSGRLVAVTVKKGTIKISNKVTTLKEGTSFAGDNVKKIVIPKSVKKLGSRWTTYGYVSRYATVYMERKKPPVIEKYSYGSWKMYVPKKSYKKYKKVLKKVDMWHWVKLYKMK